MTSTIRDTTVAGTFYPEQRDELVNQLDGLSPKSTRSATSCSRVLRPMRDTCTRAVWQASSSVTSISREGSS